MLDVAAMYKDGVWVVQYPWDDIDSQGLWRVATTLESLPDDPVLIILPDQDEISTPMLRWFVDDVCVERNRVAIVGLTGRARLALYLVSKRHRVVTCRALPHFLGVSTREEEN